MQKILSNIKTTIITCILPKNIKFHNKFCSVEYSLICRMFSICILHCSLEINMAISHNNWSMFSLPQTHFYMQSFIQKTKQKIKGKLYLIIRTKMLSIKYLTNVSTAFPIYHYISQLNTFYLLENLNLDPTCGTWTIKCILIGTQLHHLYLNKQYKGPE